ELRSDTFTLPTDEMRQAMAAAELGDDVWDEDPTVHRLQRRAAEMVGKEAALLVPSGTMGNLCALLAHTSAGDEVLVEAESHIFISEVAGAAVVGGLQLRPLMTRDGHLTPDQVRAALREPDIHEPRSALLCLENTHNRQGGICLSPGETRELAALAHSAGMKVHLDGARVFNAAVAQRIDVTELTGPVDSVMFCLSKGLSAPVGSMLAGSAAFVEQARRRRKMLGGGMRQAGVLAAAGLVALRQGPARLPADHENAGRLARALAEVPGIELDLATVRTNIVIFRLGPELCDGSSTTFLARLQEAGVLGGRVSRDQVRLVTHRDVNRGQVDQAIERIRGLVGVAA
ncbi:MAG TPA: GntG family PLP-dependent aldolase, partial [Thermoanaerobaculia bacterium]|nr:GntG family PLP-dependent aldolase [Thermoanaerobaculia bacterium]